MSQLCDATSPLEVVNKAKRAIKIMEPPAVLLPQIEGRKFFHAENIKASLRYILIIFTAFSNTFSCLE